MLKSAHSGTIRSLQYSDNDRLLLSASDDKLCKLWDVSNPSVSPKFKLSLKGHHNWIRKAVITSDGTIACSVSDDKTWRLWDVCSGGVEIDRRRGEEDDHKHRDSSSTLRCVALRPPAGTSIAIGDSKGGLRVYDTRSRRKNIRIYERFVRLFTPRGDNGRAMAPGWRLSGHHLLLMARRKFGIFETNGAHGRSKRTKVP